MDDDNVSKLIKEIHKLSEPMMELVRVWIDSNAGEEDDLRVPLFALSKVSAIHIQAMVIGLELDDVEKEKLIQLFFGSVRAALTDLYGFARSEEIINKMMGKSCD
jgi:hypothetical protein